MLKGYFVDEKGRVFILDNGETSKKDEFAKELVEENNRRIQEYNDKFAEEVGKSEYTISDWFRFQEGLMPYIREAAETVRILHEKGYTQYKVNMQSGIIK